MVEDDDEEEPEGRGPDDVLASGLALPPPDFLFLTCMGLGGPGCWTTTLPLSLFVCAAVDAPRALVDRVLGKKVGVTCQLTNEVVRNVVPFLEPWLKLYFNTQDVLDHCDVVGPDEGGLFGAEKVFLG